MEQLEATECLQECTVSGPGEMPDTSGNHNSSGNGNASAYFVHPAYLQTTFQAPLVCFETDIDDERIKLFFHEVNGGLVCCNRLAELSEETIGQAATFLFARGQADFLCFEDIVPEGRPATRPKGGLRLSYQENWLCELSDGLPDVSSRQKAQLRRRKRQLQKFLGEKKLEFRFSRCSSREIDQVIEFNRETVSQKGRNHSFKANSLQSLKAVCAQSGYIAGLYADGKLLAADIISIVNGHAYFHIIGYDMAYSRFSPGLQIHLAAIEECCKMGCKQASFLWGNSRWKADMGGREIPLQTLFVARNFSTYFKTGYWKAFIPYFKKHCRAFLKNKVKHFQINR